MPAYGMRRRLTCYACARKLGALMADQAAARRALAELPAEDLELLVQVGRAASDALVVQATTPIAELTDDALELVATT